MNKLKTNVFYHGDCLFVMKHDIPAESIDLIYLDPPFFGTGVQKSSESGYLFKWNTSSFNEKNLVKFIETTFKISVSKNDMLKFSKSNDDTVLTISGINIILKIILDKENRKAYLKTNEGGFLELKVLKSNGDFIIYQKKKWKPKEMQLSYDDSKKFWSRQEIRDNAPEWLLGIASMSPESHYSPLSRYLYYMRERLQECHRVLKSTGSIYLHCDWRASHYLKMMMDEVFGYKNFKNEVIWHYFMGTKSNKYWGQKHDIIFFYTKKDKWNFTPQKWKRRLDFKPGLSNDAKGSSTGEDNLGYYSIVKGDDVWDIKSVFNMSNEYVNYPTQKPKALLKRIILASSNEGDIVLDPFCGCGSTVIAAYELNRRWIGIDTNEEAFGTISKDCAQQKLEPLVTTIIERTLELVIEMIENDSKTKGQKFERWVNEFCGATKPYPDDGVDGIMEDGTPIQVKSYVVGDSEIRRFPGDARDHPKVPQPCNRGLFIAKGFNEKAIQQAYKTKKSRKFEIKLIELKDMLKIK